MISKLLDLTNGVIVSNIAIEIIQRYSAFIAKRLVTPITMALDFFIMKGVIERL